MPATAIPAIATAGGSIGAGLLNYFGAKKASQPGKVEEGAQRTQTGAANQLTEQGSQLSGFGMPKLQQAGNYFSTLAGGNRAATTQALAPETEQINALYGGTQRTLQRFLKGPDRDYQMGELTRQRTGALGSLFSGARERGVSGLVSLGQYGTSQGAQLTQGAAGIAGDVARGQQQNRLSGYDLQRQAGQDTASLIFQLLKGGAFKWGSGGKIPSIPVTSGIPGSTLPGTPISLPGQAFNPALGGRG